MSKNDRKNLSFELQTFFVCGVLLWLDEEDETVKVGKKENKYAYPILICAM